MSSATPAPIDSSNRQLTDKPNRKSVFQVSLQSLFLLMMVFAVWTAYFVNSRQVTVLSTQITGMRPLVRQLDVDDPNRMAVVKLEEMWFDENIWHVYLPTGQYQLCIATRSIAPDGLAPAVQRKMLEAGTQHLALEMTRVGDVWRITVTRDKKVLVSVDEPDEWYPASGSTGGGQHFQSTQLPSDQPMVLFRRRFSRPLGTGQFSTPMGPTEGILLWIEPAANTEGK